MARTAAKVNDPEPTTGELLEAWRDATRTAKLAERLALGPAGKATSVAITGMPIIRAAISAGSQSVEGIALAHRAEGSG